MRAAREAVLDSAPDAGDAGRRLDRIAESGEWDNELSDDELQILSIACGRAPYLATLLARDPKRLRRVAADPYLRREKPRTVCAANLADTLTACPDLNAALRRYRGDEMVRLGAREFGLGRDVEVGRELAHLAEVCFDAAVTHHRDALVRRWGEPTYADAAGQARRLELAVIGMGKLGGKELNFSSDVDVIYIYSSDAGELADVSLHEFASEWCRRVTASIGELTEDEFVFRVDLRLRPEGSRGPIANSVESAEHYYESWGRPWERQAWLKARPSGGSRRLGTHILRALEPFVYPRHTSPSVIREVTELNRRIKTELDGVGIEGGFDVKNGVGGIREIEFFVQALQLIHAGQRPGLRTRSTLATLDQLLFAGLVSDAEQRALVEAYRFLRHVEHARQLETGRQTQHLPTDRGELDLLARRLGFPGTYAFTKALTKHTAEVARLFGTLGADNEPLPGAIAVLLDAAADTHRTHDALKQLGFRDVDQAEHNLEYARRKPASPLGPAATGAAARVMPDLLRDIAESPDPDQALGFVVDLIGKRGSWSGLWRLFEANPVLRRLVASLMGTSAYLTRTFVNYPELIDVLVQAGRARPERTAQELHAIAGERMRDVDPQDEEAQWNQLAELKQAQVLRIGLADIAGDLDALRVCEQLSNLADVCLQHAYRLVTESMNAAYGPATGSLAVLGLGKLGGRELGYASDLDIVFIYDGDADAKYLTRVARRLVSALHAMHRGGRLYETDTRLRPDGSKGLLVSSLDGWRRYHKHNAWLWERQALTKLRPVAGDSELGARVADIVNEHVYGAARESPSEIAVPVRTMRNRIETERGSTKAIDIKAGRGGLIDIEFAAQALQLAHGHAHESLRVGATVPALQAAADAGVADPEQCALLIDNYRYLRALEHRIRIVHDRSEQRFPADRAELDKLARRMRYENSDELVREYRERSARIRAAYESVLADL